ncbi:hypothetical protein ABC502_10080 [Alkalimonas sp. NCh-2]
MSAVVSVSIAWRQSRESEVFAANALLTGKLLAGAPNFPVSNALAAFKM